VFVTDVDRTNLRKLDGYLLSGKSGQVRAESFSVKFEFAAPCTGSLGTSDSGSLPLEGSGPDKNAKHHHKSGKV
jgi:hypothetical protein